jgi:hypothetical protein
VEEVEEERRVVRSCSHESSRESDPATVGWLCVKKSVTIRRDRSCRRGKQNLDALREPIVFKRVRSKYLGSPKQDSLSRRVFTLPLNNIDKCVVS